MRCRSPGYSGVDHVPIGEHRNGTRAVVRAKIRAFADRLGLLGPASTLSIIDSDSEASLMENKK